LSVATRHAWQHAKWFYFTYELIIVLVFFCELPFIYIINRVVGQAINSKKLNQESSQQLNPEEIRQTDLTDEEIDRELKGEEQPSCDDCTIVSE
jgi:hypothetical protein